MRNTCARCYVGHTAAATLCSLCCSFQLCADCDEKEGGALRRWHAEHECKQFAAIPAAMRQGDTDYLRFVLRSVQRRPLHVCCRVYWCSSHVRRSPFADTLASWRMAPCLRSTHRRTKEERCNCSNASAPTWRCSPLSSSCGPRMWPAFSPRMSHSPRCGRFTFAFPHAYWPQKLVALCWHPPRFLDNTPAFSTMLLLLSLRLQLRRLSM